MARTGDITLEQKIEKAQQAVIKTKEKYDEAAGELKKLLDKKEAARKDEIMAAIVKSKRSYDEILDFIDSRNQPGK